MRVFEIFLYIGYFANTCEPMITSKLEVKNRVCKNR